MKSKLLKWGQFEELMALARARVTRSLTDAECRQYLHVDQCPP